MISSSSRALSLPPLPWPMRIVSVLASGTGHSNRAPSRGGSEDIFFSQRDVHQVPQQMQEQGVSLLNAMNRPRLDHQDVLGGVHHASTVAAREGDGEQALAT